MRKFVWIATDAWAGSVNVLRGNEAIISSIMAVTYTVKSVKQFDDYMVANFQNENFVNSSIWNRKYKEWTDSEFTKESENGSEFNVLHSDGYVAYTINAVLALAHALHDLYRCGVEACLTNVKKAQQRDLMKHLKQVKFTGILGEQVSFSQDATIQYDIYMAFQHDMTYVYRHVGIWKRGTGENQNQSLPLLEFNISSLWWNTQDNQTPISTCSKECSQGQFKIPLNRHPECCWNCNLCAENTITSPNKTECLYCPRGTWPDNTHTHCHPKTLNYLHWDSWWGVVILVISFIGIVAILVTYGVLVKYKNSPVVKASSRKLSYVLLIGLLFCFLTPLAYIAEPTEVTCKAIPFLLGASFATVVGTLLTKTNRISRIFGERLYQTGRTTFLSDNWQIACIAFLLFIEMLLSYAWVYTGSDSTFTNKIFYDGESEGSLLCSLPRNKITFSIWLVYNAGLVLICTYQAFLIRKVPQNYNESKFIAFTMITICTVMIIYIPAYLGTNTYYNTVISCFVYTFIGCVSWTCIFIPKLYIILLKPQKNVPMRPSVTVGILGTFDGRHESRERGQSGSKTPERSQSQSEIRTSHSELGASQSEIRTGDGNINHAYSKTSLSLLSSPYEDLDTPVTSGPCSSDPADARNYPEDIELQFKDENSPKPNVLKNYQDECPSCYDETTNPHNDNSDRHRKLSVVRFENDGGIFELEGGIVAKYHNGKLTRDRALSDIREESDVM